MEKFLEKYEHEEVLFSLIQMQTIADFCILQVIVF